MRSKPTPRLMVLARLAVQPPWMGAPMIRLATTTLTPRKTTGAAYTSTSAEFAGAQESQLVTVTAVATCWMHVAFVAETTVPVQVARAQWLATTTLRRPSMTGLACLPRAHVPCVLATRPMARATSMPTMTTAMAFAMTSTRAKGRWMRVACAMAQEPSMTAVVRISQQATATAMATSWMRWGYAEVLAQQTTMRMGFVTMWILALACSMIVAFAMVPAKSTNVDARTPQLVIAIATATNWMRLACAEDHARLMSMAMAYAMTPKCWVVRMPPLATMTHQPRRMMVRVIFALACRQAQRTPSQ